MTALRSLGLALLVALIAAAPASAASRHHRAVPYGFLGVAADGPVFRDAATTSSEMRLMARSGVETVRVSFYWSFAQPYRHAADVPADQRDRFRTEGGVPTDYTGTDAIVAAAARRGLRVLPVVQGAPTWDRYARLGVSSPPRSSVPYARYMTLLVRRYGPRGSFWRESPGLRRVPIRSWEIWNEPDLPAYWGFKAWAPGYVRLLRFAYRAVHRADRHAKVVLGGLTNLTWLDLAYVYRAGGRRYFDVASIHPFTRRVSNWAKILRRCRAAMDRAGDRRKPMLISEFSWPSARGRHLTTKYGFETTERGQASDLVAATREVVRLRHRLRISGLYWFTWLSPRLGSPASFDYSGLRRLSSGRRIVSKPSFYAFRTQARRLE